MHRTARLAAFVVFCSGGATAIAGELYAPLGIPGIGLGYAQPLSDAWGLRGDYVSLGQRSKNSVESGINYQGQYKLGRGVVLLDLFPFAGSFRVSAGATFLGAQ